MAMKFELVTPEALVVSLEDVTYVKAPGIEGSFGVMVNRAPFVSTLQEGGKVTITRSSNKQTSYIVKGGFAEVNKDGVTILAEGVEKGE